MEIIEMFEFGETTLSISGTMYGDCTKLNKVILRHGEKICELQQKLDGGEDSVKELSIDNEDLKNDNEMLVSMCDELQDENDEYIDGFFTMKEEIRGLEAKNKQLSLTLDEVECENEILFNEKDEVELRLRECEAKLFITEGENHSLEYEKNTLDSALECLEDECNRLCKENHSLYINYECSKLRVEEFRDRIFELSSEMQYMSNDGCEPVGCQSKYGTLTQCCVCRFRNLLDECEEFRVKNHCGFV